MLHEIQLGQVEEGDIVIWPTRICGDVYAEVIDQSGDDRTDVVDDNDQPYSWRKDMIVLIEDGV